jgi:multidrug efflux pump subunit AcrB
MKITHLAVQNRVAVIVLTGLLSIAGLIAYLTIPKEAQPQIEFATIVVTTVYPGASPDDIESIITQEIEAEVAGISGIDDLRSVSSEGVSTVIIEFTPDVDVSDAEQEVRDAVDVAQAEFPSEVEEPIVSEIDTSEFPVVTINLAAEYSLARLRDVAEDLQDEVEGVPGVLEVDLIGGLTREVQVNVDLAALQATNLSFNDVIGAIQRENTSIPGGSIDIDRQNYLVRVDGEIDDPSELSDLVVKAPGGVPIYVRDVAEVVFGFKDRASYARLEERQIEVEDGVFEPVEQVQNLQVISLIVKKRPGQNIIELVDGVRETVAEFPMPSGTEVVFVGDASEEVATLVADLENNIISGLLFVVAVLLFFLGVRNATLVGIAIPLSMFLSFILFAAIGQTLNFIILFSLIIALGMLVDNAVVIVENIYRYREEGHERWDAVTLAVDEVGAAVAASTLTTVAAFAPMMLWPGIIGKFMSYMPLTLIVTLTASLFVALIINPVITGYLVRLPEEEEAAARRTKTKQQRTIGYALVAFTALVVGIANWKTLVFFVVAVPALWALYKYALHPAEKRFTGKTLPRLTQRYRDFLDWMLQRDYTPKRALLKNTLALGAFTVGFLLLIGGALLGNVAQLAGMLLLVPGGILLLAGVIGIFVHSAESVMLGRWLSVKAGAVFAAVIAALCVLLWVGGRITDPLIIFELMLLPGLIVAFGLIGAFFLAKDRERLLLTDNRARLLTATLGLLFAIIAQFAVAPTGVVFFPDTDPNQVQITLEGPLGTNIEASNQIAEEAFGRIESALDDNPESAANTKNLLTQVGVGGDAQFGGGSASAERSRITMNMVDYDARAEPSPLTLRKIRERLAGIPGVTMEITKEQNGPPTGKPVNIEVSGPQFDEIVEISRELKARLVRGSQGEDAPLAGLVDVTDDLALGRPEFRVNVDRERAARFGLSTQQVAQTVRAAVNGVEASTFRDGSDEYDITVRLRERDRERLESLQSLTILDEGQQIPLAAVADVEPAAGLGNITRLDQERVVTVQADAAEGVNGNELLARVQAELADYVENDVPAGYTVAYTGESEEQAESFGFLTTALLIGVALISIILIWQFNSVLNPLIIMIAVGLSLTGVLLGLIVTRTPFGLFTFIGIISLAGIVVNNAIVLVDYVEQLREKRGMSKRDAVIEGGATRLRPVLLTAFTTVLGLIPLSFGINIDFVGLIADLDPAIAFGSENTQFWGPMGTAIISGLTFATFLTLVIVPVMYSAFDSVALRLRAAMASGPEPAPVAPARAYGPEDFEPKVDGYGDGAPTRRVPR